MDVQLWPSVVRVPHYEGSTYCMISQCSSAGDAHCARHIGLGDGFLVRSNEQSMMTGVT